MATRSEVKALAALGLSASEIARRLGVAGPTVTYHLARAAAPRSSASEVPAPRGGGDEGAGRSLVATRERVADLLARGLSRGEIARELGVAKSTVSYHVRRLGAPIDQRGARRYDWRAVQRYYDDGHSVRRCQQRFGFSRQTWHAAVSRGAVVARPPGLPLSELLVDGVHRGRHNIKVRLLRSGLKRDECEQCGLKQWRGRPLALALHHVNGMRHDNRLENLVLLCPNCHSQTANFAGRNRLVA